MSVQTYAVLPLCIDGSGHRFRIEPATPNNACCERCGLIRVTAPRFRRGDRA